MDRPSRIADLPLRMTTSEVCTAARFSKRTLQRRIRDGLIDLRPIDRGREQLYLRTDVVRALGLADEVAPAPAPADDSPRINVDAIRAARAAAKAAPRQAKPKQPTQKVEPMTPDRHRAFLLNLRPGIRVWVDDDGRYSVMFVTRRTTRASSWPPVIALPRDRPGPITLATQSEYDALVAEAEAVRAECKAALDAERAQEGPNSGR